MTEDELIKKLFNRLESMDDSMQYIFDSLIECWSTAKMALFVAYCKNREVLLNKNEQKAEKL